MPPARGGARCLRGELLAKPADLGDELGPQVGDSLESSGGAGQADDEVEAVVVEGRYGAIVARGYDSRSALAVGLLGLLG